MTKLQIAFSIITGVIALAGFCLSIYNAIHQRKKDDKVEYEEDHHFALLAEILKLNILKKDVVIHPEIGSDQWKIAERMVEKKILKRDLNRKGYRLASDPSDGMEQPKALPDSKKPEKVRVIEADIPQRRG